MIVGFSSFPRQDALMLTCLKRLWQAIGGKVAA